ncbi:MAG TPA: hypothetical protein VEC16_03940 [Alphaproteobacteria bacterium]|nr:hypothetical protein [Alphaproteobacteria bacterium]
MNLKDYVLKPMMYVGLAATISSCASTKKVDYQVSKEIEGEVIDIGYDLDLDGKFEMIGYYLKSKDTNGKLKLQFLKYDSDNDQIPDKFSYGLDIDYIPRELDEGKIKVLEKELEELKEKQKNKN